MISVIGKDGKMLPAIRNAFTLVFCIAFFFMGWFSHMNWSLRGEADQLIKDAKVESKIRMDLNDKKDTLRDNITEAIKIEQNNCNCGDATDIDFMRQLRQNREERFRFN